MKGIIFDLDGVICSTDEFHYKAWCDLAAEIGIANFTKEDNYRQRGVSRMESLEILLEKSDREYTPEEKISLADYKNNIYVGMLKDMSQKDIYPGVMDTLEYLKNKGFKLAIGSSSKNAGYILEKIGLKHFFDAISDGNNITKSKPDPEVFIKAAEYLKLSPKECFVVEDAEAGIDAAKAGGFTAIAIGSAVSYEKADFKLIKFEDLKEIVSNRP